MDSLCVDNYNKMGISLIIGSTTPWQVQIQENNKVVIFWESLPKSVLKQTLNFESNAIQNIALLFILQENVVSGL